MANELQLQATSGWNVYAIVRDDVGQVWNGSGWEDYQTANLEDYDIPMAEEGTASGHYVATFPAGIEAATHGTPYGVYAYRRLGGSVAEGDPVIGSGHIPWKIDETGVGITQAAADKVWSSAARTLTGFGTLVTDIWHKTTVGEYPPSTMGKLIIDYLNAAITSRSSHTAAQAGTAAATRVLATPGNLLATDVSGRVDVGAIDGSATAAENMAAAADSMVKGVAVGGTLTTTQMTTDLTEDTGDHYKGRQLIFLTGELAEQATEITGYVGASKKLAFVALTEAPEIGDAFLIV